MSLASNFSLTDHFQQNQKLCLLKIIALANYFQEDQLLYLDRIKLEWVNFTDYIHSFQCFSMI